MTRYVYNPVTRKWDEGKAAPENIAPHLKQYPSEYVTKDIEDDKKIHEFDDRHIVDDLVEDLQKAEETKTPEAKDELPKLSAATPGTVCRLTQWEIDVVRLRVLASLVDTHLRMMSMQQDYDPDLSVHHLWFPEDNVNHYELRTGNPPSDRDRPKHLKKFNLEIDFERWPQRVVTELKLRGVKLPELVEKPK